jgi:putative acetyltransferase
MEKLQLIDVTPQHTDLLSLISKLDAYLYERYPTEEVHVIDFVDPNVHDISFVVAYYEGIPVGCGAIRPLDSEYTELKRFYVDPEYRQNGIAGAMLTFLESNAKALNFRALRLETGEQQPEAIRFYQKHGFYEIAKFGK